MALIDSDELAQRRRLAAKLLSASATAADNTETATRVPQSPSPHNDDNDASALQTDAQPLLHVDTTEQLDAAATSDEPQMLDAANEAAITSAPPAAAAIISNNAAPANVSPSSPTPSAADDAVRSGASCTDDLATFCAREANILAVLENVPSGIDAASVAHAVQSVQLCMAQHIDALSPACIDALVADIVNQKKHTQHNDAAATAPATVASVPDDEDSSVEVSIHYTRHRNSAGLRRVDHQQQHAQAIGYGLAPSTTTASFTAASADSDFASPLLLWLVVLPFFCIGLYTTYNFARVYVRRRREIFRIESKQYAPLP